MERCTQYCRPCRCECWVYRVCRVSVGCVLIHTAPFSTRKKIAMVIVLVISIITSLILINVNNNFVSSVVYIFGCIINQ